LCKESIDILQDPKFTAEEMMKKITVDVKQLNSHKQNVTDQLNDEEEKKDE